MDTVECGRIEGAIRVLVVDDNPVVRRLVAAHLRRAGHSVSEAADGREALQQLTGEPTEVVITDLSMPHLGGLDLLARLRERESAPEVILLTGTHANDAQAAVQALRLGAHDYISKTPDAVAAVLLAVERAAEKWRLRQENARLVRQLRELSLTDELTGSGNRRAFDGAIRQEIARARRRGSPLSLVLFDLDHFKSVNDRMGHTVGDAALAAFAERLRSGARESDRAFRYGGEEFALLLPETDLADGARVAARLVEGVADRPLVADRCRVLVTCSAGAAGLTDGDDGRGETLVARADAALYAAKRSGRNRVVAADAPLDEPAHDGAPTSRGEPMACTERA